MTDPEIADRTYVEPLTVETVSAIIEREKPDALLPTVGGQTALNLSVELHEQGILEKHNVKLIGANVESIYCQKRISRFARIANSGRRINSRLEGIRTRSDARFE
jgi:carbamoylphosphate synthase large subunit